MPAGRYRPAGNLYAEGALYFLCQHGIGNMGAVLWHYFFENFQNNFSLTGHQMRQQDFVIPR